MTPPDLPSPGVSALKQDGSRSAASHQNTRSLKVDPIQQRLNEGKIREVTPGTSDTAGVAPTKDRRVLEIRNNTRNSAIGVAEWLSADGKTYSHRYKDTRTGKMLPNAFDLMFLHMFRELALDPTGGSLCGLFAAYKIKVDDMTGQAMFPITIDMLRAARVGGGGAISDAVHEPPLEHAEFTIGEED